MSDDRLHVLFVDDEPLICRAFVRSLAREALKIRTATSVVEAMSLLGSERFAVIVSDYRMPDADGVSFLCAVRIAFPDVRRVMITGFCDFDTARDAIGRVGIDQIVIKPWDSEELVRTVLHAAKVYRAAQEQRLRRPELGQKAQELDLADLKRGGRLQTLTPSLLDGLVRTLDLRDAQIQWHSRRVAMYSRRIAEVMRLDPGEFDGMERGALLHDIGKIGISDAILQKPGRLTPSERTEMQRHPVTGYRFLAGLDYLEAARNIILQSHERWDGQGYPAGLKGAEVVMGARIFRVADTLDAITTDRAYRVRSSFAQARAEIQRCAGSDFDPAVVDAYASVRDEEWAELSDQLVAPPAGEPLKSSLANRLSVIYREPVRRLPEAA